nr:MAG TPA: hypothetical protein [Caudoviricetes sp.]
MCSLQRLRRILLHLMRKNGINLLMKSHFRVFSYSFCARMNTR